MNSCCIISWNNSKIISGLRLKRQGDKRLVEKLYSDNPDVTLDSFAERLKAAHDSLKCRDCDFIAVTGAIENSIWLDLNMPDLPLNDTIEALQYELPQLFPLPQDEIIWQSRKISSGENARAVIRIFALPTLEWDKLCDELEGSGITADSFISPFMALDPTFADRTIYLPAIDEDFYFDVAGADGCRRMRKLTGQQMNSILKIDELRDIFIAAAGLQGVDDNFMPALLVAEYLFSGNRNRDAADAELSLPLRLKPSRLKLLKMTTFITGLVALIGLGTLGVSNWLNAYQRYGVVAHKIAEVKDHLQTSELNNKKSKKHVKIIENTLKSMPEQIYLLDVLCDLSRKLPQNMWVTSYRVSGHRIYITIKSSSESNDIQAKLRTASRYHLENFRSRRNLDGTYYIYLQLKTWEKS